MSRRSAFASHGVAIESRDLRAGPERGDFLRDLLGPESPALEIRSLAGRTCFGYQHTVIAVVASGAKTIAPFGVDDERHAAVRALDRAAALPAEHRRRQTAPVQENQALLSCVEPRRDGVLQPAAQNHIRTVFGVLQPHVDDRHRRERPVLNASLHQDPRVASAGRVLAALERRRGRSQHDERILVLAAHHRHVAPVDSAAFPPA